MRNSNVSRVSKVSKKVVKASKAKCAKILSAPKSEMKAINEQRAYLAKYRAFRLKMFKKYSKTVDALKAVTIKGKKLTTTEIFRALKEKHSF